MKKKKRTASPPRVRAGRPDAPKSVTVGRRTKHAQWVQQMWRARFARVWIGWVGGRLFFVRACPRSQHRPRQQKLVDERKRRPRRPSTRRQARNRIEAGGMLRLYVRARAPIFR